MPPSLCSEPVNRQFGPITVSILGVGEVGDALIV
jgi:hypothetical protein